MLNEGEIIRRSQSLAGHGVRAVNHFRAEPDGLEGVTGGRPRPVGAGWGPLGGASRDCWRGLGVDNVDGRGRRGIGSSGCWAAIVAHIHSFPTIGGGIG